VSSSFTSTGVPNSTSGNFRRLRVAGAARFERSGRACGELNAVEGRDARRLCHRARPRAAPACSSKCTGLFFAPATRPWPSGEGPLSESGPDELWGRPEVGRSRAGAGRTPCPPCLLPVLAKPDGGHRRCLFFRQAPNAPTRKDGRDLLSSVAVGFAERQQAGGQRSSPGAALLDPDLKPRPQARRGPDVGRRRSRRPRPRSPRGKKTRCTSRARPSGGRRSSSMASRRAVTPLDGVSARRRPVTSFRISRPRLHAGRRSSPRSSSGTAGRREAFELTPLPNVCGAARPPAAKASSGTPGSTPRNPAPGGDGHRARVWAPRFLVLVHDERPCAGHLDRGRGPRSGQPQSGDPLRELKVLQRPREPSGPNRRGHQAVDRKALSRHRGSKPSTFLSWLRGVETKPWIYVRKPGGVRAWLRVPSPAGGRSAVGGVKPAPETPLQSNGSLACR